MQKRGQGNFSNSIKNVGINSLFFELNRKRGSRTGIAQPAPGKGPATVCIIMECGVEETCSKGVRTLMAVLELKLQCEDRIKGRLGRRATNAQILLKHLLVQPIISINDVGSVCDISFRAASLHVKEPEEMHLLAKLPGQSRNRLYSFEQYLRIFDEI